MSRLCSYARSLVVAAGCVGCSGDDPPCLGLSSGDYEMTIQEYLPPESPIAKEIARYGKPYFSSGDKLGLSYTGQSEMGPGLADKTSCVRATLTLTSGQAFLSDLWRGGGGVGALGPLAGAARAGGAVLDDRGCSLIFSAGIYALAEVFDGAGFSHQNEPGNPALFWGVDIEPNFPLGTSTPECDVVMAEWGSTRSASAYAVNQPGTMTSGR